MLSFIKNFKVSYPYPLEYPAKFVETKIGVRGLLGWLYQKYGSTGEKLIMSERIVEVPLAHQYIGKYIGEARGQNILEVGPVASSLSLELASMGFVVDGVDLREYHFTHPNLSAIRGDFLEEKFSKKYDCIISLSVIEHFGFSKRYGGNDLPENKQDEQAFHKISELLKENGIAIISVPFARAEIGGIWFRVYTRSELEKKLGDCFEIREKCFFVRKNNMWQKIENMSDDPVSPHDGVAFFVLARKK